MTAPDTDNRLQVRVNPGLAGWLHARSERMHTGSNHVQAKLELDLWRSVLAGELRRIRLTLAETSCLADVLNGTLLDPTLMANLGIVYAVAYDAFRRRRHADPTGGEVSSYAAKWEIDEMKLLDYLGGLGPAADHALRDAIVRWWDTNQDPTVEGFAAVGLRVTAPEATTQKDNA